MWPSRAPTGHVTPAVWGCPTLQSGGLNQKWPQYGPAGHITPAVWGVPKVLERERKCEQETKLEIAPMWLWWLQKPAAKGVPQHIEGGDEILANYGVQKASKRVTKLEVAPMWVWWLHNSSCVGGSPTLQTRGQTQN